MHNSTCMHAFTATHELAQKLLNQIELKKLPKEIIIKYWLRIYTMESEFYYILNESL